ncbi:MAG: hypothetical protein H0W28_12905 [Pyrinomonadaceae bacterium]|nr:hypothetical protein [Pyrinomonadaceae bacterium]
MRQKSGVRCRLRGLSCGQLVDEVTGDLRLYYGAADSSIAVAHGKIKEMLDWLRKR